MSLVLTVGFVFSDNQKLLRTNMSNLKDTNSSIITSKMSCIIRPLQTGISPGFGGECVLYKPVITSRILLPYLLVSLAS